MQIIDQQRPVNHVVLFVQLCTIRFSKFYLYDSNLMSKRQLVQYFVEYRCMRGVLYLTARTLFLMCHLQVVQSLGFLFEGSTLCF